MSVYFSLPAEKTWRASLRNCGTVTRTASIRRLGSLCRHRRGVSIWVVVTAQAVMRVAAKAPSDVAFWVYTAAICLDTSRFEHRLMPLSRTLLPVPSQWFD